MALFAARRLFADIAIRDATGSRDELGVIFEKGEAPADRGRYAAARESNERKR